MTYQHIQVSPYGAKLGAEISGLDLSKPMESEVFAEVKDALYENIAIFFHGQDLTPETFKVFCDQWGQLEDEPFIPKLEGAEGVHQFRGASNDRQTTQNLRWHVDHSYRKYPSMGAMLYAVDVPPAGGDTMFANMYAAYEDLSDSMKSFLEGLTAVHDVLAYGMDVGLFNTDTPEGFDYLKIMRENFPPMEHPLVCTHPVTGRKFLYVNQSWVKKIPQLSAIESRHLIEMLNEHSTQPKYQCRYRWKNGDLIMWDNHACIHSGIPDYVGTRAMYRGSIEDHWEPS